MALRRTSAKKASLAVDYLLHLDLSDHEDARYFEKWLKASTIAELRAARERVHLDVERGACTKRACSSKFHTPHPNGHVICAWSLKRLNGLSAEIKRRGR